MDYFGIPDQTGKNGNISADPLFVDVANSNFRLLPASPGIDAGRSDAPSVPPVDLDALKRINSKAVDMGAYEFQVR